MIAMNERQREQFKAYFQEQIKAIAALYDESRGQLDDNDYKSLIQKVNNYAFKLVKGEESYQETYIQGILSTRSLLVSSERVQEAQNALQKLSYLYHDPYLAINHDYDNQAAEAKLSVKEDEGLITEARGYLGQAAVALLHIGNIRKQAKKSSSKPEPRANGQILIPDTLTQEEVQKQVDRYVWPRVKVLIEYRKKNSEVENIAQILMRAITDNVHCRTKDGVVTLDYPDAANANKALNELWQAYHRVERVLPHLNPEDACYAIRIRALSFAGLDEPMHSYAVNYMKQKQEEKSRGLGY